MGLFETVLVTKNLKKIGHARDNFLNVMRLEIKFLSFWQKIIFAKTVIFPFYSIFSFFVGCFISVGYKIASLYAKAIII